MEVPYISDPILDSNFTSTTKNLITFIDEDIASTSPSSSILSTSYPPSLLDTPNDLNTPVLHTSKPDMSPLASSHLQSTPSPHTKQTEEPQSLPPSNMSPPNQPSQKLVLFCLLDTPKEQLPVAVNSQQHDEQYIQNSEQSDSESFIDILPEKSFQHVLRSNSIYIANIIILYIIKKVFNWLCNNKPQLPKDENEQNSRVCNYLTSYNNCLTKALTQWLNHQNIICASLFRKDSFDVGTAPTTTLSKPDRSRPPDLADTQTTEPKFSGLHLDTRIQQFHTHMHENITNCQGLIAFSLLLIIIENITILFFTNSIKWLPEYLNSDTQPYVY